MKPTNQLSWAVGLNSPKLTSKGKDKAIPDISDREKSVYLFEKLLTHFVNCNLRLVKNSLPLKIEINIPILCLSLT